MEEEAEEVTSASPRRGRSSNASSASPEFEFWMVGTNPSSFPPPHLLSADELFADGVLLPLHLLHYPIPDPIPNPNPNPNKLPHPHPQPSSGSKRWRDIFRVAGEKRADDKERRRDRKGSAAAAAAAEIGINIWPFARSRSAGNGGGGGAASRSRAAAPGPGRKASSAPCSRSNSRGESSSSSAAAAGPPRRWAASPGRAGGVHVGRSSPVWQIRRAGKAPEPPRDKVTAGGRRAGAGAGAGARVLRLNVNTCIGYRSHVSCRGDAGDNKKTGGDGGVTAEEASGGGGGNGSLFNLRNLFSSKKVY